MLLPDLAERFTVHCRFVLLLWTLLEHVCMEYLSICPLFYHGQKIYNSLQVCFAVVNALGTCVHGVFINLPLVSPSPGCCRPCSSPECMLNITATWDLWYEHRKQMLRSHWWWWWEWHLWLWCQGELTMDRNYWICLKKHPASKIVDSLKNSAAHYCKGAKDKHVSIRKLGHLGVCFPRKILKFESLEWLETH